MGFLVYLFILFLLSIFISFLIVLHISRHQNSVIPINWPLLGSLPATIVNAHRLHDYATDILTCNDGTFVFKSPLTTNTNKLCTTNPLDVHHIMSKNFSNYPRGHRFRKIFDILGDGFSNTDGDLWHFHRRTIMPLLKSPCFGSLLEDVIWNKVESGLLPVLEYLSMQEVEIDLQDIFERFSFDTICKLLLDHDPKSISLDFPYIPCEKALSEMAEVMFWRYIMPRNVRKLQQLLRVGNEKKLSDAWKTLDQFIYTIVAQKQDELNELMKCEFKDEKFKLSTALLREYKDQGGSSGNPDKFLRDVLLNLLIAGRDTTSSALSWFFYLLAKNPMIEDKIREELHRELEKKINVGKKDFRAFEFDKLVYLHGALSEALRLFPPVPYQHKTPLQPDILPSGHQVDRKTMIILSYYSMGRMKSIWGDDCMEFKPERWISVDGRIIRQPSYKFPAFNAGPRACLGKNMSFTQLKIVAATIICHYHVDLVEGHLVFPSNSVILKMKNGLKVTLTKREVK
ncbi:alkane hydroxylase MAH1 [Lactuca sativa]|uniref:alkane hydroxylase MAH1 n=1 Tax=Lactuca sativa TaxID=4236 RepID=UPI000CAD4E31|nr:alkane hydroxylase MAH1 [Lactuca sativa]